MRRNRCAGVTVIIFFLAGAGLTAQAPSAPPPPAPAGGGLAIPAGQKFIMQLETSLHTRTTRKGDKVEFTTAADILVNGQVAIPDRSSVRAVVTESKRAGRLFGRAEIQLKFEEIRLADGSLLPLRASITRVGFDPVDPNKDGDTQIKGEHGAGGNVGEIAKGSAQGAIVGVLFGGAKGAAYGGATGAAVTVVGMMMKRGPDVDLPRTTMFEARFEEPLEVPARAAQQAAQVAQSKPAEKPLVSMAIHPAPTPPPPELPEQPRPELKRREPAPNAEPTAPTPEATPPAAEPKPAPPVPAEANPAEAPGGVTLSINVRMVQVDAVVRDRAGHMIESLKKDDFRVYEDGVLQEIQSFSRDELPLAVALVIDRSGSEAPYISELRRIATRALDQLKPDDEVALFSFAADVQRVEDLTTDRQRITDGIARIHPGGGTDIVDALHDSVTYLGRVAPDRRHAVILISDNQATVQPQASEGETIRTAMETETVVYSIKTAGEGTLFTNRLPSLLGGSGSVSKITQETGGEIINAGNVASLDAALASVISRLRMRYSLGYYPSSAGQGGAFHSITVKLTEGHGKAGIDYFMHARRGYYSTADRLR
jgi:Ca-activated chloride channel family protein